MDKLDKNSTEEVAGKVINCVSRLVGKHAKRPFSLSTEGKKYDTG